MRKILAILFSMLSINHGLAATPDFFQVQPSSSSVIATYEGKIGQHQPIVLSVQVDGVGHLEGRYALLNSSYPVHVSGSIKNDQFILIEYDAYKQPTFILEGTFKQQNMNQLVTGSWVDVKGDRSQTLNLKLRSLTQGDLDHRYAVAGVQEDNTIDASAQRFVNAVKVNDKDVVAQALRYPILVYITPKRKVTLRNEDDLKAHYDQMFNPVFRQTIVNTVPLMLYANSRGMTFGDGWLWFDKFGRITELYGMF